MQKVAINIGIIFVTAIVLVVASGSSAFGHHRGDRTNGYRVEVRSSWGSRLPTFHHRGRTYVMGKRGQRYDIIVRNYTGRRIEAVVSVDGRDAIDGRSANWRKRGYIVEPWGKVTIDGFRVSKRSVAAFRFSRVADSYAARMGNAREVGVIGVAIYKERRHRVVRKQVRRYRRYWYHDYRRRKSTYRYRSKKPAPREYDRAVPDMTDNESSATRSPRPSAGASGRATRLREAPKARRKSGRFRPREDRAGLGTKFGERRHSPVHETRFVRASYTPTSILTVRYNNRRGLERLGIRTRPRPRPDWRRELRSRESARPFANMPRRYARPPQGWNH